VNGPKTRTTSNIAATLAAEQSQDPSTHQPASTAAIEEAPCRADPRRRRRYISAPLQIIRLFVGSGTDQFKKWSKRSSEQTRMHRGLRPITLPRSCSSFKSLRLFPE
jgi:hypothetical protein